MDVMTVAQAALVLGVCRQRVHQLIQARGVVPLRVGRMCVLTEAQIEAMRPLRVGRPARIVADVALSTPT